MLAITIPEEELWDETNEKFVVLPSVDFELEHSLISLSKWEQKYEKPFLSHNEQTDEEALYYLMCMIITPDFSLENLSRLTPENLTQINEYINSKMTATWFSDTKAGPKSREVITNELIYFWMSEFGIPYQPCETWHLNRLFTLIKVSSAKRNPPKKMSKAEAAARQREINEQRRAALGTRG